MHCFLHNYFFHPSMSSFQIISSNNCRNARSDNREGICWTNDEIRFLVEQYHTHGAKWSKILKDNPKGFHEGRRPRDLKLKWDQLNKKSSYYNSPLRVWVQVEQNEDGNWEPELSPLSQPH